MKRFLRSKLVMTIAACLMIAAAFVIPLSGSISHSRAAATDPVNTAVDYAKNHWNWKQYNNSTNLVHPPNLDQPDFQCAEFVARAISAAGPIGNLTPYVAGFEQLEYPQGSGTFYNLKLVSDLYRFLINSGVGTDVGSSLNPQTLTLGSVVVFGSASEDFEHVAIVTNTNAVGPSNIVLTQHNT